MRSLPRRWESFRKQDSKVGKEYLQKLYLQNTDVFTFFFLFGVFLSESPS